MTVIVKGSDDLFPRFGSTTTTYYAMLQGQELAILHTIPLTLERLGYGLEPIGSTSLLEIAE